jgi:wyosine [tRNA(Phe)-imidazoG37] synthetase (radical SAM superfamily)
VYDVEFYMKSYDLLRRIKAGEPHDAAAVRAALEDHRSPDPIVYNIETTNACNMRCEMCPRTTMMTRPVETMRPELFEKIVAQLRPFSADTWRRWERFVADEYDIHQGDVSENHFFLLIIPRVIQLHGYGDPLLDHNLARYVKLLSDSGLESYFSCNPANIDMDRTEEMFKSGLGYIKYSVESVDDRRHKEIRGDASDFSESYARILRLLELKQQHGYQTVIVITMLDLNRENQKEDYDRLREAFAGRDVYLYLKSEDQQWYRKDYHGTQSVHWGECCKHPWMSMTIKSNGEACMCMEDFDNEIVLGDARRQDLRDIWNGDAYRTFRQDHFDVTPGLKCSEQCDMMMVGQCLSSTTLP